MRHIIINPVAGSGSVAKMSARILNEIDKYSKDYVVFETTRPMEAAEFAEKACKEKSECIICIGGDGTVNETASGMIYSGVPLGIVPLGSGNDFVASVGINRKDSIDRHIKRIFKGTEKTIDAVRSNDYCSANVASVGFDSEVVFTANSIKKTFGRAAYLIAVLMNVFKFKNFEAEIHMDGIKTEGLFTLLACGNGRYYGGGFEIIPSAVIDDGLITVCVVRNFSKLEKLLLFPTVLFGTHIKLKGIEIHNCKKVEIRFKGSRKLNLDGNLYEESSPISFEILPEALKIIV